MCDCYQIGGPWIAEDPDCPTHGIAAQGRRSDREFTVSSIRSRLRQADDIGSLKEIIYELLDMIEE